MSYEHLPPTSLDFARLAATPAVAAPFPHLIVPQFVRADFLQPILADFPQLEVPGSVPLPELNYGPAFAAMIDALRGPTMTKLVAEKLQIDLTNRPTMVTVRGMCRASDGQIHTDSKTKLVTVLLYLNPSWEAPGGRLRLLSQPNNLQDYAVELPPDFGTLLVFKNSPTAWHGHESFAGQRRTIQLNWVTSQGVVMREQLRHRVSAFFKRLKQAA